ncbi:MAG: OB-fold nucleic acid binding domain-containing protein [Candidatus Woesearchaeota archaeon]
MIRIPYDEMLAKIEQKTGLSRQQIQERIDTKLKQLSGLISKEGAAHIIANELGVKLLENSGKIKDIYAGMRSVEFAGKVQAVYPLNTFSRQDGTEGKVSSCMVADETGVMRVVGWGEQAEVISKLEIGNIVKVSGGLAKENQRGYPEVHVNEKAHLIVNPAGIAFGEVRQLQQRAAAIRKEIKALQDGDENVEVLGTIVQVFDPRFFEICPTCNGRAKEQDGNFVCEKHGVVKPDYAFVMNLFLDDGTDNIRCVLFRQQAERLLGKTIDQLLPLRHVPEQFEPLKTELLGQIVKLVGRVKKNTFFDRLEFNVQMVFLNPDPQEELARLQATVSQPVQPPSQ